MINEIGYGCVSQVIMSWADINKQTAADITYNVSYGLGDVASK